MGRDGREVWAKRVARWRESGLSAREFASETGINASSLSHWAWKLARGERAGTERAGRRGPEKIGWVEVVPPPAPAAVAPLPHASDALEIVVDGRRTVRVPSNFDADVLRRVLAVLEAR
jgi:hypothetical protein